MGFLFGPSPTSVLLELSKGISKALIDINSLCEEGEQGSSMHSNQAWDSQRARLPHHACVINALILLSGSTECDAVNRDA